MINIFKRLFKNEKIEEKCVKLEKELISIKTDLHFLREKADPNFNKETYEQQLNRLSPINNALHLFTIVNNIPKEKLKDIKKENTEYMLRKYYNNNNLPEHIIKEILQEINING